MHTRGWPATVMGVALSAAIAAMFLMTGCGGTEAPIAAGDMAKAATPDAGGGDDGGLLPLFSACTSDAQCQSALCTMNSYDRSATPICTYMCDPTTDTNPLCPNGCNPKGYCKMQMN